MKIAIRYSAVYQYEEPASLSPHVVRLFPRQNFSLQTDHQAFFTNEGTDMQTRQDLFDNLIARCFYPQPLDRLEYRLELDLTLTERNPFHFLLDSHSLEIPFTYREDESTVLHAYLHQDPNLGLLPKVLARPATPRPTVETISSLISWLHENIAYERREEGEAYSPALTLEKGQGSCRDFAVLFSAILRHHGVASRLVSGFLWEDETPASDRRAVNALHAWVEAYLPGAGWVGLDPTNGIFCDHHFIPTAVGLTPPQIAPVSGHYYGHKNIPSTLNTTLTVQPISL